MPVIGTDDGYWYSLLESQRIMEVHHHDTEIARTFYNPADPMKAFNRVIDRHRTRSNRPTRDPDHTHEPEF